MWQPIETAPKTGKPILLRLQDGNVTTAYWAAGWQLIVVGGNAEDADVWPSPVEWHPIP